MRRAIERTYGPQIALEIQRATAAMLREFEISGGLPFLPVDHERRLSDLFRGMALATVEASGERILGQGKAAGQRIETKDFAAFFQRLADEWIAAETIRQRITSIAETTRDQMIRLIQLGQSEGEGIDAIGRSISRSLPRISRQRAALIARTETHGAANYGADGAARATGLRLRKEWMAITDHRTRDFLEPDISDFSHRAMNGKTVAMDEMFQVPRKGGGFELLAYPGALGGSPGNVINCRCATGHIVEDL